MKPLDLQVGWDRRAGVLIASPAGRVDSVTSAALREALVSGVPSEERALLLDLSDLSYMSSAGLSVLLLMAKRFRGSGRAMGMCGLPGAIAAVVTLSGFNKIIPVYETRDAALAVMGGQDEHDPAPAPAEASPAASDEESVPKEDRSGPRRFSFKRHST